MIVATPIDLPKIEPDDWDVFWKIWEKYSDFLYKVSHNYSRSPAALGSKNVWKGLDIIKNPNIKISWEGPFYDIKDDLPNMYNLIKKIDPYAFRVRLIQSITDIIAHTDDGNDHWNIRALLYYTSDKPQWYFTKPNLPREERKYLTMPGDTNWFIYNDKNCWHGTDFDPDNKKILLQIYSPFSNIELVNRSILKYKKFAVEF
jgi:hypothetical protein